MGLERGELVYARFGQISLGLSLLGGCGLHSIEPAARQITVSEITRTICLPNRPAVDILMVIDDSPSMHGQAEVLASNLAWIMNVYEDPSVDIDYRIAVTSTDTGNPRCDPSTADDGALLTRSCLARPEHFVRGESAEAEAVDTWEAGCRSQCSLDSIELLPTSIVDGGPRRARPWLERKGTSSNVPPGVDPRDVLACMGALGISGCTFETPLAAASRAILRTFDPSDAAYGFLRPNAALLVLFITDEDDCSSRPEHGEIFEPGGDRALWSDPEASEPTSAVCWNAGVACEGDPRAYDDCYPVHRGPDGEFVDAADAVLEPVEDHIALYEAIAEAKRPTLYSPNVPGVFVRVVGGISGTQGLAKLADAIDAQTQSAFGIGPACVNEEERRAFPAPRLQRIAAAFPSQPGQQGESICADNWATALACIPGSIEIRPTSRCIDGCLADIDPATPGLQPRCHLVRSDTLDDGTTSISTVPLCEEASEDEPCWVPTTELGEIGELCLDLGASLELRYRGIEATAFGTCLSITCEASKQPAIDCPWSP